MKKHTIGRKLLHILVYVLYFLLTLGIGYGVAAALMQIQAGALRTIPLLICLVFSLCIQSCFHTVGHWIFGKLSGFEMISISFLRHTHVKEKDKIITRQALPETLLFTCLMAPVQSTSRISYTLYCLGGTICNLVVGLLALLVMVLFRWSLDSILGCFSFTLFQSGIWFAFLNALPMYHGTLPNDGLKALHLRKNPSQRRALTKNLRILSWLSKAKLPLDQIPESLLNYDSFRPLDAFTASLLIRQYELLLWRGSHKEARAILAILYENLLNFPEEWQIKIWQECVFMLLIDVQDEDLVRQMMTEDHIKQCEDMHSAESLRCLFAWYTKIQRDTALEVKYELEATKAANQIAFRPAADAWKRMIAECRWSFERSDIDLL